MVGERVWGRRWLFRFTCIPNLVLFHWSQWPCPSHLTYHSVFLFVSVCTLCSCFLLRLSSYAVDPWGHHVSLSDALLINHESSILVMFYRHQEPAFPQLNEMLSPHGHTGGKVKPWHFFHISCSESLAALGWPGKLVGRLWCPPFAKPPSQITVPLYSPWGFASLWHTNRVFEHWTSVPYAKAVGLDKESIKTFLLNINKKWWLERVALQIVSFMWEKLASAEAHVLKDFSSPDRSICLDAENSSEFQNDSLINARLHC